jgi:hypothetical protein
LLATDRIVFEIDFQNNLDKSDIDVTWDLLDNQGTHIAHIGAVCSSDGKLGTGLYRTTGVFPPGILNSRRYSFSVQFGRNRREVLFRMEDVLVFDVHDNLDRDGNFNEFPGVIRPVCTWDTAFLSERIT